MIKLDYLPGTPAPLVGEDKTVWEIPTVQSHIEPVEETLTTLPLHDIATEALSMLKPLNALLSSAEFHQSLAALASILPQVDALLTANRPWLDKTLAQADATLEAAQATATHATGAIDALTPNLKDATQHLAQVLGNADRQVGPLVADLRSLAKSLDELVVTGSGMLAPRSPLRQDTEATLRNLAGASQSLRSLAAELERNPNAVILGRAR
jgi:paraquat-inducible protein B